MPSSGDAQGDSDEREVDEDDDGDRLRGRPRSVAEQSRRVGGDAASIMPSIMVDDDDDDSGGSRGLRIRRRPRCGTPSGSGADMNLFGRVWPPVSACMMIRSTLAIVCAVGVLERSEHELE